MRIVRDLLGPLQRPLHEAASRFGLQAPRDAPTQEVPMAGTTLLTEGPAVPVVQFGEGLRSDRLSGNANSSHPLILLLCRGVNDCKMGGRMGRERQRHLRGISGQTSGLLSVAVAARPNAPASAGERRFTCR